jgi:cystathionine beta-synthase
MVEATKDYPTHSYVMEKEGLDKVCKWTRNTTEKCPHI